VSFEKVRIQDISLIELLVKENKPLVGECENLKEKLSDKSFSLLRIFSGKAFAGFVEVEFFEPEARINCFVLNARFRGKGFGLESLKELVEWLKKKGVEHVFLFVSTDNLQAKGLYEKAGFEFVGLFNDNERGLSIEELELSLLEEKPVYVS